jgi:DoxX-like protein/polyketide cyclase/dehydrase/lipid transport protein
MTTNTIEVCGSVPRSRKSAMNYTLWTVQALLAALFLFGGALKLVLPVEEMTKQIALPGPFLRFIGAAEFLGGLGLILPGALHIRRGLTPLAAAGLVVIMIGATVVTLVSGGGATSLMPFTVGLLAAFVAWGRTGSWLPDYFRVERTTHIQAPPEQIAALIDDFRAWRSWSPYEQLDPGMTRSYSGPARGKGASYEWSSKGKAGVGRMEITGTSASKITIQLDFIKPFEGHPTAEFILLASGDTTQVTWAMHGPQALFCKLMSIFFNMDKMVGKDFESGLAKMKAVAERHVAVLTARSAAC